MRKIKPIIVSIVDFEAYDKLTQEQADQVVKTGVYPHKNHTIEFFTRTDGTVICMDTEACDYYEYDKPFAGRWGGDDVNPVVIAALKKQGFWYDWETCEAIEIYDNK